MWNDKFLCYFFFDLISYVHFDQLFIVSSFQVVQDLRFYFIDILHKELKMADKKL